MTNAGTRLRFGIVLRVISGAGLKTLRAGDQGGEASSTQLASALRSFRRNGEALDEETITVMRRNEL